MTELVESGQQLTLLDSVGGEILGKTTDAKSTVTNATGASVMAVLKQISASMQTLSGVSGGAVTIADAADATLGAKADVKVSATDATPASVIALLKQISASTQAQGLGKGYTAKAAFTRPANATPYTGGDVVGATAAALTFTGIAPGAGDIRIGSIEIEMDVGAVPAGQTTFRLHLYNVTPPSALADNAVWDLSAGDRASYLGYVDLGAPVVAGASTLYLRTDSLNVHVHAAGANLYGYLVTAAGFTPGSGLVGDVTLHATAL